MTSVEDLSWLALSMIGNRLASSLYDEVSAWMDPPSGARLLDAGCGTGGLLLRLRRLRPDLVVTAVDEDPASLAVLRDAAEGIEIVHGDVLDPSVSPGPFDMVVARSMVHHLPDQVAGLQALAARLGRDGSLILGEGGPGMTFLPYDIGHGVPGLENRLRVVNDRWFDRMRSQIEGSRPFHGGWSLALEAAGLQVVGARTFLEEHAPPVPEDVRVLARRRLARYLGDEFADLLDSADAEALGWLLDPENPDGIDLRRDLHLLAGHTLWRAERAR